MPIITISRGSLSRGKLLAEALAAKLGCECIDREFLADAAIDCGIAVGKLETAMIKAPASRRRYAREREFYLATATASLCEKALGGNLVYHGHAGHLLLPGVSHVLRVRVLSSMEKRIQATESAMRLPRAEAIEFIKKVDQDRARWAEYLHGVRWHDPALYDIVVNLENIPEDNAAVALCAMAELPAYKSTPASRRALEELLLASRARIALGQDDTCARAEVRVRARGGIVSVHHMPRQADLIPHVAEVLEGLPGVEEVRCTIAETNILWIAETFNFKSDIFSDIVALAESWDASVELLRFVASDTVSSELAEDELETDDDGGVAETLAELRKIERSGGRHVVVGGATELLHSIDRRIKYSLFVVGGVYHSKPHAAQMRLARELRSVLGDNFQAAVVSTEEIKKRLRLGGADLVKALLRVALVAALYLLVFDRQEQILSFTAPFEGKTWPLRLATVAAIASFVPVLARLWGSSAARLLKMVGID